jgi:RNA polymerase sigma-70 factor (ECF subfamily)
MKGIRYNRLCIVPEMGVMVVDSSEFNRIVDKFADVVFRSALSFCGNKSDAEDITQNAFIKLLKSNVDFENDDHIRKWLIRVTANESKSLWRSFWSKKVISFQDLDYEPAYIESDKNEVFTEVMKLPEKYRTVLHLYYYEGYQCGEIASVLGISESNVQTRLMRARNMLKEKLGEAWL